MQCSECTNRCIAQGHIAQCSHQADRLRFENRTTQDSGAMLPACPAPSEGSQPHQRAFRWGAASARGQGTKDAARGPGQGPPPPVPRIWAWCQFVSRTCFPCCVLELSHPSASSLTSATCKRYLVRGAPASGARDLLPLLRPECAHSRSNATAALQDHRAFQHAPLYDVHAYICTFVRSNFCKVHNPSHLAQARKRQLSP